ncbi:MAG: hypothetical protein HRT71_01650 [Flavobacteriales bacterium]|nr:hypothetical protein [Flavobacteriales bacterium]
MKLLNWRLIALIILTLGGLNSYSQTIQSEEDLERRVKNLEEYENTLKILYENKIIELKNNIDIVFKEEKEDQKKQFDDLHSKYSIITYFGLPTAALAFVLLWFGMTSFTKKKIEKEITEIVEAKRNSVISIIKSNELDTRLRKESKLLILSSNQESETELKRVFIQLNFDNTSYRVIEELRLYDGYDLIIINNKDGSFDKEVLAQYLKNTTEQNFVAFTNENLNPHERLNHARTHFTLYARVMESLKYLEVIKVI